MQKTFESFLVLIIFYGVYSAFSEIALLLWDQPSAFWVVIVSLIAAALLLVLYSQIIKKSTSQKYTQKLEQLEHDIHKKEHELDNAFKIKRDTERAAEESIKE